MPATPVSDPKTASEGLPMAPALLSPSQPERVDALLAELVALGWSPRPPIEQPKAPTTTSEQDLRTKGQRRINMIWEYTQASIAIVVVLSNIIYVFALLVADGEVSDKVVSAASLLTNAFFLVIGFYFGRTNHARIGDDSTRQSSTGLSMDDRDRGR